MLISGKGWCRAVLLSMAACLSGCMEVEQHVRVHDDGAVSIKATIKLDRIDPHYEATVFAAMSKDFKKKLPPGTRVDFSQRIDGKAAVIIEADGPAGAEMLKEDGSTTITVSDGGFMKKRYEYRGILKVTIPFPHRAVVSLPGSIESVLGGKKIASDTVEFDLTHAKPGDVFAVTSTAFAFGLGSGGATAAASANPGTAAWLIPLSVGSIGAGVALFVTGWFRSRQAARANDSLPSFAPPTAATHAPMPAEEAASQFCTECGAANTVGRRFCGQCGHAMG